jgi:hypothetical protein
MNLKKYDKAIILMIGFFALMGTIKNWYFKDIDNEIIVDGHHVSLIPCQSAVNDIFGKSIDSTKMCSCLIPKFYQLIKDDSFKLKKFEETGFFTLEGKANDSLAVLFKECASNNIADSNYKLKLTPFYKAALTKRFRDQFETDAVLHGIDYESYLKCVFDSLDGKITIKEFLADDYLHVDKIRPVIYKCVGVKMEADNRHKANL